jgi:hypothetical protein
LSGGRGHGTGGTEGGSGTDNCADIAGVLHTGKNDEERRASGGRNAKKVVKRGRARLHESRDALGMLGVGEAFEKAIGGAEQRESHFGPVDEGSEALAVALAGFAEEDGLDAASGPESLLNKADAFNADAAGFGGQPTAEGHAKGL